MSAAIQTLIENKETELANNKHARDHYNEYYGYLAAECEQEIYDLNVRLQLAEAEEEDDEGWNVGLAARQTATWVPYADGGDQLCYKCNGYTEACGCGEEVSEQAATVSPAAIAAARAEDA